ncbi:hypothetical protein ET989_05620 [Propioniciclava sinopodophylli]|uniref:Uncharacterized protein n=1 Tax=Propioniciclava sinopodophylli TaxID=1837344 RepID=A0A4Q9KEM6_9ACTN|nr:hypothetical protein [Propioniciclava sinopodophylli]TBT85930.1 hypothetical protein ET989_05620 [Propioniciclava sinopodophylli]
MSNPEHLDPAVVALLLVAAENEETFRAAPEKPLSGSGSLVSPSALARLTAADLREGRFYRKSKGG